MSEVVSFRVADELLEFLQQEADKRHVTLSMTVNRIVIEYAENSGAFGGSSSSDSSGPEITASEANSRLPDELSVDATNLYHGSTVHENIVEIVADYSDVVRERDAGSFKVNMRFVDNNKSTSTTCETLEGVASNVYRYHGSGEKGMSFHEAVDEIKS